MPVRPSGRVSARSARSRALSLASMLALALSSGTPGWSQPPPSGPPTFDLPEVEVAGKRPELPSATPASISVITPSEIAALGALTVADVLRVLPELRIKGSGGPGALTTVSIRGSTSNQVLIMLDGVPLNRPDQSTVDLSTLPIQNVDHIEVLRGPFSALYSSVALGGVINIVTRSAPQTSISARAGSYGQNSDVLSFGGQVSGLSYLIQGIGTWGNGFAPDTDYTNTTAMAKFRWDTAPDADVALTVNQLWHSVGTPGPLPVESQDLQARTWENRTLVDLAWRSGKVDGPGALARFYVLDDGVNFSSPGTLFESFDSSSVWGIQLQGTTAPWQGHLLTIGAEYQTQDILHTDNTPAVFATPGSDLGFYIEDDWQISRGTLLSLGLRQDTFQSYGGQVNPRLGVVFLLNDRLAVRAGAGRTFRAPSFDELAPTLFGNPALQPETAWAYDIGVEYEVAQGLALHLSGYYTDATNLIVSVPPLFVPENVGHAEITGGSIELAGRLGDRWSARINYTNQQARDAFTGLDVIYIPRQTANAEITYRLAPGKTVSLVVSYVGGRFNDAANTQLVPEYWLSSLVVTWPLAGGFAIQAGVNNLFNVTYQETLNFPEPGRTFFVTLAKVL